MKQVKKYLKQAEELLGIDPEQVQYEDEEKTITMQLEASRLIIKVAEMIQKENL